MNQALRRELIERIQPIDEIYPGELKVIAVGRLEPQKDYVTLLEAFAIVRRATPCRLIILGEGSEREKLERLAEELGISGSVDMKGYVQFPIKYVRQCNVFVLTSRWEGFGNVLVEALATGIQVVSTDCPHGPREILGGGKFGKLIPTADKEAVALEVLQALGSTRTTADMEELAMHLGQFNAERIAEQYLLAIAPEVPR